MGSLAYTVTSARPRTIANPSIWAGLPTQGNYGSVDVGFRSRIDNEANLIAGTAVAVICRGPGGTGSPQSDIHKKVLTLAVAQKALESSASFLELTNWRGKIREIVLYIANTLIPLGGFGTDSRRSSLLALAYGLDLVRNDAGYDALDLAEIGGGIIVLCDAMTMLGGGTASPQNAPEMFDGHTAGDQACQFIGAIALHGETGFTSGANNAADNVAEAVNYWWGGDTTVTFQGTSRLAFNRYFCANGGHGKSPWYSMLEGWYTSLILQCAENSLTSMTLDGEAYSLPTGESWVDKVGEWFLNFAARGDMDYWHIQGDTSRITNPWMHEYTSTTLAYLIAKSPTWRGPLRWIYDKILTKTISLGQNAVYNRVPDYVLFDPGHATYAPIQPSTAGVTRSKLMDPPGIYVYRNNWDIGGAGHCAVVIEAQSYFWRGHSSDLKCGSIQIQLGDDIALMNRGLYATTPTANTDITDFGGSYTNNWARQSISSSGVPLIDDLASPAAGSPNYAGTPHANANASGISTPYPHAQGGQLFRWDHNAGGPPPVPVDPITIPKMTGDGSGLTWRLVTGISGSTSEGLKIEAENNDLVFLTADLHRCYISRIDHYNTGSDRVEICNLKLMVIKDPLGDGSWPWPVVFRVAKVKARQASYVKRDVWSFYGNPNVSGWDAQGEFFASGYRATAEPASIGAKCLIAYHNASSYRCDPAGDNSTIWTGTTANHHAYTIGNTTTLTKFPIGAAPNNRQLTDIGRWRVEVKPLTAVAEDTFVNAILPMGKGDIEPDFTLLDDANYWIIRFGDPTSKRIYKIHKTAVTYEGPTDPLDVLPPDPPVIAATAGPGSGQVTVSWNPPPEPDFRGTSVEYRIKV